MDSTHEKQMARPPFIVRLFINYDNNIRLNRFFKLGCAG
jgi:hypothetical protein